MFEELPSQERVSAHVKQTHEEFLYQGARGAAIRILSRFERSDSYLDKLLEHELRTGGLSHQDKALLTELVNGVTRWLAKLDWVLTGFYHGEFDKCMTPVKNAMRIALYQVMFLNKIPPAAAINESVEIIKRIKGEKSAGIVNAVLRNITRNLDNIRYPNQDEDMVWYLSVVYSHPKWMVKRWMDRWGQVFTEELLKSNVNRPSITLRVNGLLSHSAEIESWLDEQHIPYTKSQHHDSSLLVSSLRDITSSEMFKSGKIAIQDASASMAALLSQAKPGMNVIDLCSAPGGKTFYVAELMKNQGSIIALDKYEAKLRFLTEGAQRLGIDIVHAEVGDARSFEHAPVELVLADVPCTGFGTLSKKPDIKWKRDADDITKLIPLQRDILSNAAKMVKPGGTIVYSTCTIEADENEKNIEWFLQEFPDFSLDPAEQYLPADVCENGFLKTIPGKHSTDGAFAARLIRKK
ncbi:MAG: 16S rRNA (cytosine(967)-C(5))-methyltransferase RsmB [Candidatus Kapaibacteriota bacterium]